MPRTRWDDPQDTTDVVAATLTIEANGSSITGPRNGGAFLGPATDTAITAGPHAGMWCFASTRNTLAVDDFAGADLDVAGVGSGGFMHIQNRRR